MVNPVSIQLFPTPTISPEEYSPEEQAILYKIDDLERDLFLMEAEPFQRKAQELLQEIEQLPRQNAGSNGLRPQRKSLKNRIQELLSEKNTYNQFPTITIPSPPSSSPLENLPGHIIQNIFQNIPLEHLRPLLSTSRRLQQIATKMLTVYLFHCRSLLSLSKRNLEIITGLTLKNDPYSIIEPQDREAPFQAFMKKTNAAFPQEFPDQKPSVHAIVTLLQREITKGLPEYPFEVPKTPMYSRDSIVHLLQTGERAMIVKEINTVSPSEFQFSNMILLRKFCSYLVNSMTNEDPLPLQLFMENAKKQFNNFHFQTFDADDIEEEDDLVKKLPNLEIPSLAQSAKNVHGLLCSLSPYSQYEPFLSDLRELLGNMYTMQFEEKLPSLILKHQSVFLSIAYGLLHKVCSYLGTRNLDKLSQKERTYLFEKMHKQIPPELLHPSIQTALENLDEPNPILSFIFPFLTHDILKDIDFQDFSPVLASISPDRENKENAADGHQFVDGDSLIRELIDMNLEAYSAGVLTSPTFQKREQIIKLFCWQNSSNSFVGNIYSLTHLAAMPQLTFFTFYPDQYFSSFHIPFLSPQLIDLFIGSTGSALPGSVRPLPVFRYFGESLTKIIGNFQGEIPASYALSQSPAIRKLFRDQVAAIEQKRLQEQAHRRKVQTIQRISQSALEEISEIAKAAAIVLFFRNLFKYMYS